MGYLTDCNCVPHSEKVREFHTVFGQPVKPLPGFPADDRVTLRRDLIREEWRELLEALHERDIVAVADALGDLLYVIHGMALEFGIPLDEVVSEIHRSNLSKLDEDGKPIYREDGKVLKGPGYTKPDITGLLRRHVRSLSPIHTGEFI